AAASAPRTEAMMNMRTIDKGLQSNVEDARRVTVRSADEWTKLWRTHAPDRQPPAVDFAREMIVGVFMGSRPTAGYAIEIVGTRDLTDSSTVQYRETTPPATAATAQVMVMPYHLVAVPVRSGAVRFERVR